MSEGLIEAVAPELDRNVLPAQHPLRAGSRRGARWTWVPAALCVVVPVAILVSLGRTLEAPFWYDEQWRADYISYHGGWLQALRADHVSSIAVGWLIVERIVGEVFGSRELVLRLPTSALWVLSCLLTYWLVRRWLGPLASCVTALLATATTDLMQYGVQVKPYVVDTTTIIAVMILRELARDQKFGVSWRRPVICYLGIGVCCFVGTATVFVAAPLLAMDAVGYIRRRGNRLVLLGIGGAAALAALNLEVMTRQNPPSEYGYWAGDYPTGGLWAKVRFYWDGVASLLNNGLTDGHSYGSIPHALLVGMWLVLLALGCAVAIATGRGRTVLIGLVGSLVVTGVAADLEKWPFGYVRTNLFFAPLFILLASVGVAPAVDRLRRRRRRSESVRIPTNWLPAAWGTCVVAVAASGLAFAYAGGGLLSLYRSQPPAQYGYQLRTVVAFVNDHAQNQDAVIVSGNFSVNGWHYYLFEYDGWPPTMPHPLSEGRVLYETLHGSAQETSYLERNRPNVAWLFIDYGSTGAQLGTDQARLKAAGYCDVRLSRSYPTTGTLLEIPSDSCGSAQG
jgi:hypothetical protein